jgi:predicted ATPase
VRLHQRLGERQESGYGARTTEIAAELAMHFERGQDGQRAVTYLRQAADTALRRQAHREAIRYLERALALLPTIPDGVERVRHELMVQMALGAAWVVTKGFAAPEVEQAYTRARALCQQINDADVLFSVLMGIWMFYNVRGEPHTARAIAEQLLRLAHQQQDAASLMSAHHALGTTLLIMGEPTAARPYQEEALTLSAAHAMSFPVSAAGLDPRVSSHAYAALMFWFLGYPDRALQESQMAVQIAQGLDSPFNLSGAVGFTCLVHMLHRDIQATREQAERAITIAAEYGFLYWQSACTIVWGHVLVEQGQRQEGIAQIRQGLASSLATGAETGQAVWRALLASAYGRNGLPAEGLAVIEEVLAFVNTSGERMFEAEIYRLKGELTLQSSVQRLGSSVKPSLKSQVPSQKSLTPST